MVSIGLPAEELMHRFPAIPFSETPRCSLSRIFLQGIAAETLNWTTIGRFSDPQHTSAQQCQVSNSRGTGNRWRW